VSHGSAVSWHGVVTAKYPGRRSYVHTSPTMHIDTHSLNNIGYWIEGEVDNVRDGDGRVIRIEITGVVQP
jgi:hypothetical protein